MTHHTQHIPESLLLSKQRLERRHHREQVAKAQTCLQAFITILEKVPFQENTYTFSLDLYAMFEEFCGLELSTRFQIEFGRQISRACRDGRLPFRRTTHTRASLAAFDGISLDLLKVALQTTRTPAP